MRVVAGQAKGHYLKAPHGSETRPTSDKVREAVFSMLGDTYIDEDVLDLFAGTGALGIEALSRGASAATFVERRPVACRIIGENLRHTHLEDRGRVLCWGVERAIAQLRGKFGLILLDPPYAYPRLHDILEGVGTAEFVSRHATVVFEHTPRFAANERYSRLERHRYKVYGDTAVSLYAVQEEPNT